MSKQDQIYKAETFKAMHDGSEILVLPNASDVGSAKIVVEAGHRAIADAMGFVDHSEVDLERLQAERATEQRRRPLR